MYIPSSFAETDLPTLHDFIERHSFGLLVSQVAAVPFVTHVPMLLNRTAGDYGTITTHIARANPQWREIAGQTVLAVFAGPHAHITPAWYDTNRAVPTWNYTAVHAYGHVVVIEQPDELWNIVQRAVATYEGGRPKPWSTAGDESFARGLLPQIVGLRLKITRLEGKFKLSQNHPAERREKVIASLEQQGDENSLGVAELMRRSLAVE